MSASNTHPSSDLTTLPRRRALTGILEYAVASLELTTEQRNSIEHTYREVGAHLAKALKIDAPHGDIFPQGSYRIGTVIRPLRDITEVFDLDVVFRLVMPCAGQDAQGFREAVGGHLRAKYNGTVQPLPKGWRLDYSAERDYFLDIIPAMDSVPAGIIAITVDQSWQDTNPRGFAAWFEAIAKVLPQFGLVIVANEARMSNRQTTIEPLPEHPEFKLPLQRITQIGKRHRDYYFNRKTKQPDFAPASIVLTTMLALAYERNVGLRVYESGYDLLLTCVEDMKRFITISTGPRGETLFRLANPSLATENLVTKWNGDPRLANAFFAWHADFVTFLRQLPLENAPQRRLLSETLGEKPINTAYQKQIEALNAARQARVLSVAPTVGLTVGAGVSVPGHVIHGQS
jgi:hypothetical protein